TQEKRSVADHIDHSLDKAIDNLNVLKSDLDRQRVIELAKLIKRSRHVLVVGLDFASSLSYYLAYGLLALGFDAEAPIGSSGNLQYKVEVLTSKDVLVAISFGQCLRDTVESVLRARKQGVPIFGITDSNTSPIVIRDIERVSEMQGIETLQKDVWGCDDLDVVPLTMLAASKEVGAVLIGAYDGALLAGFVYGFPGYENGQVTHHSHMLAVRP